jgi:hypothetical protein
MRLPPQQWLMCTPTMLKRFSCKQGCNAQQELMNRATDMLSLLPCAFCVLLQHRLCPAHRFGLVLLKVSTWLWHSCTKAAWQPGGARPWGGRGGGGCPGRCQAGAQQLGLTVDRDSSTTTTGAPAQVYDCCGAHIAQHAAALDCVQLRNTHNSRTSLTAGMWSHSCHAGPPSRCTVQLAPPAHPRLLALLLLFHCSGPSPAAPGRHHPPPRRAGGTAGWAGPLQHQLHQLCTG